MSKYKFGKRSTERLATVHEDLQKIMHAALEVSQVDFGISHGYRSPEEQFELYKEGRQFVDGRWVKIGVTVTNCDGENNKSEHNEFPSNAVDIYAAVKGHKDLAFDVRYLAYLGGVITAEANRLLDQGRIIYQIRWGYNWDGDEQIGTDQRFQDMPHFELISA